MWVIYSMKLKEMTLPQSLYISWWIRVSIYKFPVATVIDQKWALNPKWTNQKLSWNFGKIKSVRKDFLLRLSGWVVMCLWSLQRLPGPACGESASNTCKECVDDIGGALGSLEVPVLWANELPFLLKFFELGRKHSGRNTVIIVSSLKQCGVAALHRFRSHKIVLTVPSTCDLKQTT